MNTSKVKLLPVKVYEGFYSVDANGNIYSDLTSISRRKGKLKPYLKNGYLAVNLFKDRKVKHHYVHRLVAQTFIPNPLDLAEVNHINCNKFDNSVQNLEWCDRKHNLNHSYEHGLKRCGESHGMHKLSENDVVYIKSNINVIPQKFLAEMYGVSKSTISAIKNGRIWKEVMPNVKD